MTRESMHSLRPFRTICPGELIGEELDARRWNPVTLSIRAGVHLHVIEQIIRGDKPINARTAAGLSRALGTSREYWLNLESAYRADLDSNRLSRVHQDQE